MSLVKRDMENLNDYNRLRTLLESRFMNERKSRLSGTFRSLRVFVVTLLMAGVCFPAMSESAGPWKGQVVDKETGKPLEGVVVLARWEKRYTSFVGEMGGNE